MGANVKRQSHVTLYVSTALWKCAMKLAQTDADTDKDKDTGTDAQTQAQAQAQAQAQT